MVLFAILMRKLRPSLRKCTKNQPNVQVNTVTDDDQVNSKDSVDTITAVLNHVIAESMKLDDDNCSLKKSKKPVSRKKSPKGDKTSGNVKLDDSNSTEAEQLSDSLKSATTIGTKESTSKPIKKKSKKNSSIKNKGVLERQNQDTGEAKPKKKKSSPSKSKSNAMVSEVAEVQSGAGIPSDSAITVSAQSETEIKQTDSGVTDKIQGENGGK